MIATILGVAAVGLGIVAIVIAVRPSTPTLKPPTITPNGGTFKDFVRIDVACEEGTLVLQDIEINASETQIRVTDSQTISAYAVLGDKKSALTTTHFTITQDEPQLNAPRISPIGQEFEGSLAVRVTCDSEHLVVNGAEYTSPWDTTITETTTITAYAKDGDRTSTTVSETYTLKETSRFGIDKIILNLRDMVPTTERSKSVRLAENYQIAANEAREPMASKPSVEKKLHEANAAVIGQANLVKWQDLSGQMLVVQRALEGENKLVLLRDYADFWGEISQGFSQW